MDRVRSGSDAIIGCDCVVYKFHRTTFGYGNLLSVFDFEMKVRAIDLSSDWYRCENNVLGVGDLVYSFPKFHSIDFAV
jgi:hypothetical protein